MTRERNYFEKFSTSLNWKRKSKSLSFRSNPIALKAPLFSTACRYAPLIFSSSVCRLTRTHESYQGQKQRAHEFTLFIMRSSFINKMMSTSFATDRSIDCGSSMPSRILFKVVGHNRNLGGKWDKSLQPLCPDTVFDTVQITIRTCFETYWRKNRPTSVNALCRLGRDKICIE